MGQIRQHADDVLLVRDCLGRFTGLDLLIQALCSPGRRNGRINRDLDGNGRAEYGHEVSAVTLEAQGIHRRPAAAVAAAQQIIG